MSGVERLDHVNITTGDLSRTVRFLTQVLGLEDGPRPPFGTPGNWLYSDGQAVVHVSDASNKEQTHTGDASTAAPPRARGIVDHVAFRCANYGAVMAKLRELGIPAHEADVPGMGLHQVFVDGPDAVSFELIFTAEDVRQA
jgi:catechol 2,3-dioxygenase-like lactoylglutathione lyase family enzyme